MNEQDRAVRGIVPPAVPLPIHPLTAILAIIAGESDAADPCWSTAETQLHEPGMAAVFRTMIDGAGEDIKRCPAARLGPGQTRLQ